jgi:hypothetical protein
MLQRPQDYDASQDSFSKPLLWLVEHKLDGEGRTLSRLNDI